MQQSDSFDLWISQQLLVAPVCLWNLVFLGNTLSILELSATDRDDLGTWMSLDGMDDGSRIDQCRSTESDRVGFLAEVFDVGSWRKVVACNTVAMLGEKGGCWNAWRRADE